MLGQQDLPVYVLNFQVAFRKAIFSASCIVARASSYFHFNISAPQRAGPLEVVDSHKPS